jgi:hypothetical protein
MSDYFAADDRPGSYQENPALCQTLMQFCYLGFSRNPGLRYHGYGEI